MTSVIPVHSAFAVAAVAAAVFGAVEARGRNPMVDLAMFRIREFSGGTGTMMIWAFGILGIYFFTSLYLQETLGFSPTKAGLEFAPMALCLAVFAILAPRVEARAGRIGLLGMPVCSSRSCCSRSAS